MNRCSEIRRVQDYLDGELSAIETESFRAHLRSCAACGTEVALFTRAFQALDAMPLVVPRPELTERVLAHVLPSRVRRRWVRAAAWGYGASFAACLAGAIAVFSR